MVSGNLGDGHQNAGSFTSVNIGDLFPVITLYLYMMIICGMVYALEILWTVSTKLELSKKLLKYIQ